MPEPVARLIELDAGRPARVHELSPGTLRVGRDSSADLSIEHPDISRHHFELRLREDGGELRDLASKNGVELDGQSVREAPLDPAAEHRIRLGTLELRLEFLDARVDRILARSGELTVRRPPPPEPEPEPSAAARPLLLPILATLAFAALLVALLASP